MIERVLELRHAGLSLPSAIARAVAPPDPSTLSLFSLMRRERPALEPRTVTKPVLIALSHAIEDETLARASARVVFGCFQREGFYRSAQSRWQELAVVTPVAAVFADFRGVGGSDPAEVPIDRRQQLAREWAIVAYGTGSSIAMTAREKASSSVDAASRLRAFELLWAVEPETVRTLARSCVPLLHDSLPHLTARAEFELAIESSALPSEQVGLMTAVINRVLAALS